MHTGTSPSSDARVDVLDQLGLTGMAPDPSLDRVVRVAARAARVPTALITVLGSDQQWVKAKVGFPYEIMRLSDSFCEFALDSHDLLEIPDASQDERVCDRMLVTGPQKIRFYAGQPIIFQDQVLGTVCVLDTVPRQLDDAMREILVDLSAMVSDILDARHRRLLADQAQAKANEAMMTRQLAERASRNKSEFLSRVSHEMRTPLNAILGFGQLLMLNQQPPLTAEQKEWLELMANAGKHLLDLIDDLLDIARIEEGAVIVDIHSLDLWPLMEDVLNLCRPAADAGGVRLCLGERMNVRALVDARRFRQVLSNLISNAIKYNKPGGTVHLVVLDQGPHVTIVIRDTGIGIPSDKMPQLFQPFNRLGADQTATPGSGLGLVISKALTEAMGGTLSIESEVGAGTTVTIVLQAASGSMAAPPNI